ncbi:uncharacterized protein LOC126234928 [Schistocerca nitens]|uniref:uncharacterized protein LOC126234928 n=1 Tax=Schistocerca nitens TaxID=7011 RepID=UPI0021184AF8|nr:uncharacterized protein LOC126234928 [Schistocerca nitens]
MGDGAVDVTEETPESLETVLQSLRCPGSCGRLMAAPIRLCTEGHSVCARHHRGACPLCGDLVLELRDSRLEAVARAVRDAPCQNRARGCQYRAGLDALVRHQRCCDARLAPCALPGCAWRAPPHHLAAHVADAHAERALPAGCHLDAGALLRVDRGHRLIVADSGDVFVFRYRLDSGGARLLAALHYVGLHENASNFRFSFELTSAAGTVRQVLPVAPAPEDEPLPEDEPFCLEKSAIVEGEELHRILNDADVKCVVRVRQVKCLSALPSRRTSVPWF